MEERMWGGKTSFVIAKKYLLELGYAAELRHPIEHCKNVAMRMQKNCWVEMKIQSTQEEVEMHKLEKICNIFVEWKSGRIGLPWKH